MRVETRGNLIIKHLPQPNLNLISGAARRSI